MLNGCVLLKLFVVTEAVELNFDLTAVEAFEATDLSDGVFNFFGVLYKQGEWRKSEIFLV